VTGEADMKYFMEELSPEFPIINQKFVGQKNRYAYMSFLSKRIPSDQTGKDNLYFAGVVKYDLKEERVLNKIYFGVTSSSGEVFFSPRDDAVEEDDGYLMTCVYDWKTEKSEFVMWDA
jgi:carotenoid cleavage dioxygenase-like enzyme